MELKAGAHRHLGISFREPILVYWRWKRLYCQTCEFPWKRGITLKDVKAHPPVQRPSFNAMAMQYHRSSHRRLPVWFVMAFERPVDFDQAALTGTAL